MARGITSSFDPKPMESTQDNIVPESKEVIVHKIPISIDFSDIKSFLHQPAPKGITIQCRIEREKGADKLYPLYYLYLEHNNQFLLAARKRKKSKTSNYLISLEKSDLSRKSGNYIGKLRSNFVGTEFVMYDKGEAPSAEGESPKDPVDVRQELGAILYVSEKYAKLFL